MLEKKYKTKDLFIGVIAKQGAVIGSGSSVLDYTWNWTCENFDIGIFIKKGNEYLRISTNSLYKLDSRDTAHQIVINKSNFHNLSMAYPELAKDHPTLTKKQILDFEKQIINALFKDKNNVFNEEIQK